MINEAIDQSEPSLDDFVFSSSEVKASIDTLSLFEEYMFLDDSPEYPLDPVFQLRFNGLLDWLTVRQTLCKLFSRHPLLGCCVTKRGVRLSWAPASFLPEVVRVEYDENPEILTVSDLPNLPRINLSSEPGLRVYYIESERESWSRLVFQFHHSVADGVGIIGFLNEWLILYARAIGSVSENVKLPKLDIFSLRERYRIGWNLRGYFRSFFDTWRSTRQIAYKLPRPLISPPAFKEVAVESIRPFQRILSFTHKETTEYITRSKTKGVTVNDLLLTDFFLAMDRWLTEVKHDEKEGRLRVMVPINMRTSRHASAPLSNVVSTVFVDRFRRKIAEGHEKLLKSIQSEMNWVKDKEQKYDFLLILKALRRVPRSLRFFLRLPICRSTGVFSNLGRVFENSPLSRDVSGRLCFGNVRLDGIEATAPLRYKTSLSVVGLTYAGMLNLCIRYDSRLINPEEADTFMEIFRSYLFPNS